VAAKQQLRDVDVEIRTGRRVDDVCEVSFVPRSAKPAPVAQHVDVDAFAARGAFAQRGHAGARPRRDGMRRQRTREALGMLRGRFGADARAGAAFQLTREARAGPLLQAKRGPA
jgi:hypothetical protein